MTLTMPHESPDSQETTAPLTINRDDYQELSEDNRTELLAQIAQQRKPGEKYFVLAEDEVRNHLYVFDELEEVANFIISPPIPLVQIYIVSGFRLFTTKPPQRRLVTPWKVLVPLFHNPRIVELADDGRVISNEEAFFDRYPAESDLDDKPLPMSEASGPSN